jgi:hypothetical protein
VLLASVVVVICRCCNLFELDSADSGKSAETDESDEAAQSAARESIGMSDVRVLSLRLWQAACKMGLQVLYQLWRHHLWRQSTWRMEEQRWRLSKPMETAAPYSVTACLRSGMPRTRRMIAQVPSETGGAGGELDMAAFVRAGLSVLFGCFLALPCSVVDFTALSIYGVTLVHAQQSIADHAAISSCMSRRAAL